MKKNKGIICLSILLFIFLVSGCESGMTEEERCEKIVEKYVDEHTPDFAYEVQEQYSTKEDTCQAMIDLAVWEYEKDQEILEIFSYDGDNIYTEKEYDATEYDLTGTELDQYVDSQRNFTSIGNMWRFDEERDLLRKQCKKCYAMYLQRIISNSCEEIISRKEEFFSNDVLLGSVSLVNAEKARREGNYRDMFQACYLDINKEILYTVYPEEMLKGAVLTVKTANSEYAEDSLNDAKRFLEKIGKYKEYKTDIKEAEARVEEDKQCDYEDCTEYAMKKVEGYEGEYCYEHAYLIEHHKKRYSSSSSSKSNETKDDPYNVYDYSDPEDFYDDNYDDFWDYEDAEDYYNEAWDE